MKVSSFFQYLQKNTSSFEYEGSDGKRHTISDVQNRCLYMYDVDIETFVPHLFKKFKEGFRMEEILPGGGWCMMNAVGGILVWYSCLNE